MNTLHTPGPWRFHYTSAARARQQALSDGENTDGGGADGWISAGPKGLRSKTIAFLPHHRDAREDGEREANDRLISAAPDLLDVLYGIRNDCHAVLEDEKDTDPMTLLEAFRDSCITAIAKATGRP